MHFQDLELCRYGNGPLNSDSWYVPLRAIGWLEDGHPYVRGPTPVGLVEQLGALVDSAERVFQQHHFRGLHDCTLCEPDNRGASLARSHINLWIPGIRTVFAFPAGIIHYLTVHSYLPPSECIDAVHECPQYGSAQYLELLRHANDGYAIPLVTWDEYLLESRKRTNKLIGRGQECPKTKG